MTPGPDPADPAPLPVLDRRRFLARAGLALGAGAATAAPTPALAQPARSPASGD